MKRLGGILILLCLGHFSILGQNESLIKEIRNKIAKADDTKLYDLLNDLAWEYRFAYPDSTIYYSNQAYNIGKAKSIKKGLARSLNYIGVAYDKKGEPINAYDNYNQASLIAQQQLDSIQIAYSLNNIGRLLSDQGIVSKALDYFIKAKKMFEGLKDSSGMAYVFQSIGRIHTVQKDYAKAKENFINAYKLRTALGNTRDIMAALVYLGDVHEQSGDPDGALLYLKKADSCGRVIKDRINLAEIHVYLARNYLAKGLLDSAKILSESGLKVIASQTALRTLPEALLVRGQVMAAISNFEEARKLYDEALEICERTKELDVKLRAHYLLWKLLEKIGKKSEGIEHYNSYLLIQDSLKDLEVTRNLERLQFEIEIQKRDMATQLARSQDEAAIQAARWQNVILSIVILFVGVLSAILWRNNKKKQEVNHKLIDQNHKLEQLNHEKDTLMSIVAHDLKSPLNRIKGLIHLVEIDNSHQTLSQYLGMIKKTTQSGLTLIGDLLDLHATEDLMLKPAIKSVSLSDLISDKIDSYGEAAYEKEIKIEKNFPTDCVVNTDAGFISRILDNLLSNAIKFSPKNSKVLVRCNSTEKDFVISVKDSGQGFSEKDKTQLYQKFKKLSAQPTAKESSNGLGLALIKILVDRLNGKIDLISSQGQGSEFVVTIPQALIEVVQEQN